MTVLPVLHGTIGQDGQGFYRAVSKSSDSIAIPRYNAELDAPSALRAAHKLLVLYTPTAVWIAASYVTTFIHVVHAISLSDSCLGSRPVLCS